MSIRPGHYESRRELLIACIGRHGRSASPRGCFFLLIWSLAPEERCSAGALLRSCAARCCGANVARCGCHSSAHSRYISRHTGVSRFRWLWTRCRRPRPQKPCLINFQLFWCELHIGVASGSGQPYFVQNALKEKVFVFIDGHGDAALVFVVAFILKIAAIIVPVRQPVYVSCSPFPSSYVHVVEIKFVRIEILFTVGVPRIPRV